MIAFASVVVDDVENDLDPGGVERLHHALEFVHLVAESLGGVAHVGSEEADRVVSPIIREPALGEMSVDDELMHGQQLECGDAEREEVLDHRIAAEAEIRAAKILRHVGMQLCHPFDVALVDDRAIPRNANGRSSSQVNAGSMTTHFGTPPALLSGSGSRSSSALPSLDRRTARCSIVIVCRDRLGVRIDEQLGRIEAVAVCRIVRPGDAISRRTARGARPADNSARPDRCARGA